MTNKDEKTDIECVARALAINHGTNPDDILPLQKHVLDKDGLPSILVLPQQKYWQMWESDAKATIAALERPPVAPLGEEISLTMPHLLKNGEVCFHEPIGLATITREHYDALTIPQSQWHPIATLLEPCPYVTFDAQANKKMSFMVKRFEGYFDYIEIQDGKPVRCIQVTLPTPPAAE